MPGESLAIAASRRFNSLSIGGAWVATASLSPEIRISAPWPPTAGNCSGAKIRSISFSERPLTKASAPEVFSSRRLSVAVSPGGTHTSRGVGARSSSVPSISSSTAHRSSRRASSPGASFGDAWSEDGISCCNGASATSWFISFYSTQASDRRGDHQAGSEQVAGENAGQRSGIDQRSEQGRADHAANAGSDRIEQRDRHRAPLQRQGFADGEIGGARGGRGKEEDDHPGD